MPRPIQATIHLAALQHNLSIARQTTLSKPHVNTPKVWGVIKADAYGHGIQHVLPALQSCEGLALLDLNEALLVRQLGWQKPILLLEGFFDADDLELVRSQQLTPVIHSQWQIDLLRQHQQRFAAQSLSVYLKMNTGMNRLGFTPEAYGEAEQQVQQLPCIRHITHMTHFANADQPASASCIVTPHQQWDTFHRTLQTLKALHDTPSHHTSISVANSAAIVTQLVHDQTQHYAEQWIRPGSMLYGISPCAHLPRDTLQLHPTMELTSAIIAIQPLKADEAVGYGSLFVAPHAMTIGIVACGYGDGYPRHAPTGTPIAVDGHLTSVVGRVSMDMLTVDLSTLPNARIGSRVELWGKQITVDEVAHAAGTIGYELMCAVAPRVPKVIQPLTTIETESP
jgi:alanine racemase